MMISGLVEFTFCVESHGVLHTSRHKVKQIDGLPGLIEFSSHLKVMIAGFTELLCPNFFVVIGQRPEGSSMMAFHN